jgi:hypothetical protein
MSFKQAIIINLQFINEILMVNLIRVVVLNIGKVLFKIALKQSSVANLQLVSDIRMVNGPMPTYS